MIKTYPLNNIDYQAEDAELFHCTRTSGIYASGHFPVSVTGADNNITIGKGIGWLKNTEFSGKVFASKEATTLNAGVPDASLSRVDAIVVRFDANQNETYFTIKQGSTGSTPTPPEVERGEYIYELHLYHIRRRPGATAITPGDITDLRMDANYCGLMADSVTQVDMSAINAQVREFISDWENQIANVTDGKMIESPEYPGCYYRLNGGVVEWLNPPMMVGEEYRLAQRDDGKRVYTKQVKFKNIQRYSEFAVPGVEKVVSISAVVEKLFTASSGRTFFQVPCSNVPPETEKVSALDRAQVYFDDGKICVDFALRRGQYDLYVTINYTRSDDADYTSAYADGDILYIETSGATNQNDGTVTTTLYATVDSDGSEYINSFVINGIRYNLATNQAGNGAPSQNHPGVVGQIYMDTDNGNLYKCVSAENGVYVWESANEATKLTAKSRYRDTFNKVSIEAVGGSHVMKVSGETEGVESTDDFVIIRGLNNPVLPQDAANKKYVDSAMRSGSGFGDLFSGYDRFYNSIARLRVNPTDPLEIPTYDGTGQTTHPCVRFFPGGWNGHSWWMANSPYANSSTELENPCLAYSDDGYTWSSEGIPNPLALPPEESGAVVGYNSDPHLLLRPDGVMEVWWRTLYQSGSNAGCEVIYRRTSADGRNWTEREELHRVQNTGGAETSRLCPVALYEDGVYKIWIVYQQECLRYYESAVGTDWQYFWDIDVNHTNNSHWKIWHFDINHTAKGYEFVGSYMLPGDYTSHKYIYYAVSTDNITYSDPVLILMPGESGSWDDRLVYRPSIVRLPDRVMIYYGAQNANLEWHIGQIEAPSAYLFDAVRRVGERVHGMETKLAALEGAAPVEGVMIVQSFEVSPWLPGYWKPEDGGAMTQYDNFHHSQLIPLANLMDGGELPEITVTSSAPSFPVVRVNYFDGCLRWIGATMGEVTDPATGTQNPTPINWPAGAVYFAISANTSSKDDITVTIN